MKSSLFSQMRQVIFDHRGRFVLACFILLLSNAFLAFNPLLFRYAVGHTDQASVYVWALLLLAVASLSALFQFHMRVLYISMSRDAEADLRSHLFRKLQRQSQAFFDRFQIGDLMSRLTNDIAVFREVVGPGIMYPCSFVALVIPALIAMGIISWHLTLVALIPIVVIPPLMIAIRKVVFENSRHLQASLGEMSTHVREGYSSIRLIKSYVQEKAFGDHFHHLCRRYFGFAMRLATVESLFFPFMSLIGKLTTVALVTTIGWLILRDNAIVTPADAASFMWIQSYLLVPVLMLGWILPLYQKGRGAYHRLTQIDREPMAVVDEGDRQIGIAPSIELQGLTFSYGNGPVLKDVTTHIEGGTIVGIAGSPGSGKSSLLHLLHRDYPVTPNQIFIDGKEIHEIGLENLRRSLAVVEEEPFVFSMTVAENIALSKPNATLEEIEQAAKKAQLDTEILPFQVGERGITLSGGQRQRVAIARALLAKSPILLLDDAFSALDTGTARNLFAELRKLEETTIVLASHRTAILEQTDHLLYFHRGELVESGKPQKLAKGDGHYATLVALDQYTQEAAR